jgi:hypothetical protein
MPSVRLDAALAAAPQISHERVRFMRGDFTRDDFMRGKVGRCRALGQDFGGRRAHGAWPSPTAQELEAQGPQAGGFVARRASARCSTQAITRSSGTLFVRRPSS